VYIQGLGGLSTVSDSVGDLNYGRVAGYLLLGALVQLLSTLAISDASRAITEAATREAEHHNLLAEQHSTAAQSGSAIPNVSAAPSVSAAPDVGVAASVGAGASPAPDAVPAPDPNTSPVAGT
jgi:hypothetical protein